MSKFKISKKLAGRGKHNIEEWVADRLWPTPLSTDWKRRGKNSKQQGLPEKAGGMLNPEWIEWLMGFPAEWTDLKH